MAPSSLGGDGGVNGLNQVQSSPESPFPFDIISESEEFGLRGNKMTRAERRALCVINEEYIRKLKDHLLFSTTLKRKGGVSPIMKGGTVCGFNGEEEDVLRLPLLANNLIEYKGSEAEDEDLMYIYAFKIERLSAILCDRTKVPFYMLKNRNQRMCLDAASSNMCNFQGLGVS